MGVPRLSIWDRRGQICFIRKRISEIREEDGLFRVVGITKRNGLFLELLGKRVCLAIEMGMI